MKIWPLLSLLIWTPLGGAVLLWLLPGSRARLVAGLSLLATLVLALTLLLAFDPAQPGFQFVERYRWMPTLNVHILLGVDGLSVLFPLATTLAFCGTLTLSWNSVHTLPRLYYSLLLLLLSVTIGLFCSLDLILFFLFWELTLVPLYFLTSLWGVGPNRRHAASKYTFLMLAGGVPLLFGFLLLAFNHAEFAGSLAFDLPTLLTTPIPDRTETVVFLLLLAGFAVKTPVFPLHTWLLVMASEAPVSVTALLVGLKLGAYGLIRIAVPLAPDAAVSLHWLLAGMGTLGLLYGALGALAQTNLRRMLAYASLSHVGLVLLGISAYTLQGIQGALLQLLNFTLIASAGMLLCGSLLQRTGTTEMDSLGGVATTMPQLAAFLLLFGLAGLGLPGTSTFPAELMILLAALKTHTGAGLAALAGIVLSTAAFLDAYRRTCFGPIRHDAVALAHDLLPRERLYFALTALLVLLIGLQPDLILDTLRPAAENWLQRLK